LFDSFLVLFCLLPVFPGRQPFVSTVVSEDYCHIASRVKVKLSASTFVRQFDVFDDRIFNAFFNTSTFTSFQSFFICDWETSVVSLVRIQANKKLIITFENCFSKFIII